MISFIQIPKGYMAYNIAHREMLNIVVVLKIWGSVGSINASKYVVIIELLYISLDMVDPGMLFLPFVYGF